MPSGDGKSAGNTPRTQGLLTETFKDVVTARSTWHYSGRCTLRSDNPRAMCPKRVGQQASPSFWGSQHLCNCLRLSKSMCLDVVIDDLDNVSDIANTGCGLTPADRARLFTRFFRAAPAAAPGLGLGLSLARELARAQGGDVQLGASDPRWTRFVFTLPAGSRGG